MATTINASTSAGLVSTADTSGVLQLQTAGTTALTISTAQLATLAGGLNFSTLDAGITFNKTGALTNSTLNDYEAGTWTPTDGSGAGLTFTTALGYYTKIGRVVQFSIQVVYPSTADTTAAKIGSFPFAFANANAARGGAVVGYSSYAATIGLLNDTGGVTTSRFYVANGGTNVTNANLSTATIYLSGTYST